MQDFPFFTTQNGIASLTLRDIPYWKKAYVRLQEASDPDGLLLECVDFAKTAGAEEIFAAGHSCLEQYPFHTAIWDMRRDRAGLPDTDAALFPVQAATMERWREIYNTRMAAVDQASYMSFPQAKQMLRRGEGYFVHRGDTLLGIGMVSGEQILAIASVEPGGGRDTLLALNHALSGDIVTVEVASTNRKAIRLYESLGFLPTAELSRWHRVPIDMNKEEKPL